MSLQPRNRDDAIDRILADIGDMRRQLELLSAQLAPQPQPLDGDFLVTLSQCAGLVMRRKRTLEKYLHHRKYPLPEPYIRGEGGKPNEYRWSEMRVWLEKVFSRTFPESPSFLQSRW